jgi:hypothetical protein
VKEILLLDRGAHKPKNQFFCNRKSKWACGKEAVTLSWSQAHSILNRIGGDTDSLALSSPVSSILASSGNDSHLKLNKKGKIDGNFRWIFAVSRFDRAVFWMLV